MVTGAVPPFVAYDHTGEVIGIRQTVDGAIDLGRRAVKEGRSKWLDVRRDDIEPPDPGYQLRPWGLRRVIDRHFALAITAKGKQ